MLLRAESNLAGIAALTQLPPSLSLVCAQDLGGVKYKGILQTGSLLAEEYGVVQGLFKGLTYRIALISTTFFLVNTFKGKLVPFMFPHAVAGAETPSSSKK